MLNESYFKHTPCHYCPQYLKDGLEYCFWICYIEPLVGERLTRKCFAALLLLHV